MNKRRVEGLSAVFEDLADALSKPLIVTIVRSHLRRLSERVPYAVFSSLNRPTVAELVAIYQSSAHFVGSDSGPMHLATASDCQVIALARTTELLR